MTEESVRSAESRETPGACASEPSVTQDSYVANPSEAPGVRRSGRVPLAVPILLIGSDTEGKVFTEHTQTVVVSRHGAGILSRNKLIAEQLLVLRDETANREAEVRVVGEIGQQESLYAYGVAFVDQALHFWQMNFPSGMASAERPATLLLECSGCGDVVELTNGDYEYDICAIHGGLAQYCEECGLLTVWRRTEKAAGTKRKAAADARKTEAGAVPEAMRVAAPMKSAAKADTAVAERRSRVRAKVNFFACVRTREFGDDVVRCIDMSKGGVSFRGGHVYTKNMEIEIAVPFAKNEPGVTPLFVHGRIANVREDANGGLRYGVEFLRR